MDAYTSTCTSDYGHFSCIFQNEPASPVKLEKVKVEGSVTEDNKFKNWRKLCKRIADHPSYND